MSMFQWHIKPNPVQEAALLAALRDNPKKLPIALRDATNRTARTVKTMAMKAITDSLPIKRADIDENKTKHRHGGVHLTLATVQKLEARIRISGKRIALSRFSPRPKAMASTAGARYKLLKKGESRHGLRSEKRRTRGPKSQSWLVDKATGRRKSTTAFMTQFKSGHLAIVQRANHYKSTKRGRFERPLVEMFGPSIPQVAERSEQLQRALNIDASEIYSRNLASQADRFLGGAWPAEGGA